MVRGVDRNWTDCRRKTEGEEDGEARRDEDDAARERRIRELFLSMSKKVTWALSSGTVVVDMTPLLWWGSCGKLRSPDLTPAASRGMYARTQLLVHQMRVMIVRIPLYMMVSIWI